MLFEFFREELRHLITLAEGGQIALYFCDESGFNLNPMSIYAWQAPDSKVSLPANRKSGVNILGFIDLKNDSVFYDFKQNMNAELFIKLVEDFIFQKVSKKTVLVMDKSPVHYSNLVQEKLKEWKTKGLFVQYLPSYCPELNLIEILWRFTKHYWLTINDWLSAEKLERAVIEILANFGTKYKVNFKI